MIAWIAGLHFIVTSLLFHRMVFTHLCYSIRPFVFRALDSFLVQFSFRIQNIAAHMPLSHGLHQLRPIIHFLFTPLRTMINLWLPRQTPWQKIQHCLLRWGIGRLVCDVAEESMDSTW